MEGQTEAPTDLSPTLGDDWRATLDVLRAQLNQAERRQAEWTIRKMVSLAEVGEKWDYSSQALSMIRKRNRTFPKPLKIYGQSLIFWEPEVDEFMKNYTAENE
jgi:predicted DNA-binding transcriptional regulator AlpA